MKQFIVCFCLIFLVFGFVKSKNFDSYPPVVKTLTLSRGIIYKDCTNKNCSDTTDKIDIAVEAHDAENDVISYMYEITGGKIIGSGAKVVWDLSDVKTGDYTITVWANDGCGKCSNTMTQKVKIVE